jgi:drug/metabolite transporter (DMT)-like permease
MAEPRVWVFLLVGLAASVLLALGLLTIKSRAGALPPAKGSGIPRAIIGWFCDPVWLAGLAIETTGYALYIVALSAAPVSLIAVMMQGGTALFVLFAVIFLHERAAPGEWAGIGGIVGAMLLLALSLQSGGAAGGELHPRALAVLTVAALLAATAPALSRRMRATGVAPAIASGIAFGLGSLFTKALTDSFVANSHSAIAIRIIANPWLYPAIAANIAGLVMLQNSFHWARGLVVMPLSSACSNIVPIIGGIAVFGESLPSDQFAAAMRIGAFALTILAGAVLSLAVESG